MSTVFMQKSLCSSCMNTYIHEYVPHCQAKGCSLSFWMQTWQPSIYLFLDEQQNFNEPLMFVNAIILPVQTSGWLTRRRLCGKATRLINVDKQQRKLTSQQSCWTVGIRNWRTWWEMARTEQRLNWTQQTSRSIKNKWKKWSNYCIKNFILK